MNGLLIINAGSSSIKAAMYGVPEGGEPEQRYKVLAEGLGTTEPKLHIHDAKGQRQVEENLESDDHEHVLDRILHWLENRLNGVELQAVGHRVVHGGPDYAAPVVIDDAVLERLGAFIPLAPLHQPHNLAAVKAVRRLRPALPQVACFDTAFHRRQPKVAQWFALPRKYLEQGVLRYGFHGLSYEYIARTLGDNYPDVARGRVIVAHLGNGASMCAMKDGVSIATTMGFTALDGLPMGKRCGNLDPGVVLYLVQHEGMSVDQVEDLLYRNSGLLGVSGVSSDMRRLLESGRASAGEAIELFVYRAAREIGSLAAALGGLDSLVFTAGIGEHAAPVRASIVRACAWLGLDLDEAANRRGEACISSPGSTVSAFVIPTNEELTIARHTLDLLDG